MASNAPYYQLRGQFSNNTNPALITATPDDDDDYDLSTPLAPQHSSLRSDTQMTENQGIAPMENQNFVELLEAATTAAGQPAEPLNVGVQTSNSGQEHIGKRKRVSSRSEESGVCSAVDDHEHNEASNSYKRARTELATDPQLHDSGNNVRDTPQSTNAPPSHALLNDARAAGVHSAAALFRRSSREPAKKYTRPPMSKLFISLQLTPENFLQLQAQAKAYMLDPAQPERQRCVGNRGKGDTDLVKLKLFNCVRDFLNDGVGEQFFGEGVEKPAETEAFEAARALGEEKANLEPKLVWPRDGNKIISLVTPLLRRMVTNERQRMYAIETRKGGAKKKEGSAESSHTQDNDGSRKDGIGHHRHELEPSFQNRHPPVTPQTQPATPFSPIPTQHLPSRNENSISHSPLSSYSPNTGQGADMSILTSGFIERPLPTAEDRVFRLNRINIFLTKDNLNLEQGDRLSGLLANYSWENMQKRILLQIIYALLVYPQLRPPPCNGTGTHGMGPEALRGLAVAATEIETHAHSPDTGPTTGSTSNVSGPPANPSGTSSVADEAALTSNSDPQIPRYVVKVMRTAGLSEVQDEQEWENAKRDVGYSAWADGKLTVIVELV